MNLHAIVAGNINAVNPFIFGTVKASNGYSTNAAGNRVPLYTTIPGVQMQVQPLSTRDLRQLDALNLQGTQRAIYCYGEIDALIRPHGKGGDLIIIPSGVYEGVWLVNTVLEQWSDGGPASWCKIGVTLQEDAIVIPFLPALKFNDARNSQYISLLEGLSETAPEVWLGYGGYVPVHGFLPSLDFSKAQNSEYLACLSLS